MARTDKVCFDRVLPNEIHRPAAEWPCRLGQRERHLKLRSFGQMEERSTFAF